VSHGFKLNLKGQLCLRSVGHLSINNSGGVKGTELLYDGGQVTGVQVRGIYSPLTSSGLRTDIGLSSILRLPSPFLFLLNPFSLLLFSFSSVESLASQFACWQVIFRKGHPSAYNSHIAVTKTQVSPPSRQAILVHIREYLPLAFPSHSISIHCVPLLFPLKSLPPLSLAWPPHSLLPALPSPCISLTPCLHDCHLIIILIVSYPS